MVVRIRFQKSPGIGGRRGNNRRMALAVAALLTPVAALAAVVGLWRIAADLNWAGSFAITSGLFSHWQAWLGAAALLQLCSRALVRYARRAGASSSS